MKILTVCKRCPQGRDMMLRPYGRFHYIPQALRHSGEQVAQIFIDYSALAAKVDSCNGVNRFALRVTPSCVLGMLREMDVIARNFSPDWVAGFSDSWIGLLALRLARRSGARLWLDAYDNFDAYMPWNIPLHRLWRSAVSRADLVTAAGPQLAGLMQSYRRSGNSVAVLPMAADPLFFPRDRQQCRARLGLPEQAPLLGYTGSWTASRGTHLIIDAFRLVRSAMPDARLVLSGRPPLEVLQEPGVIGTGYLDDEMLPLLVSALDVACIVVANTNFGAYSYPAKMYEAISCGVPVVASDTQAARWILGDCAGVLAPVGDAPSFAAAILATLKRRHWPTVQLPSWSDQAELLRNLLANAT